MYTYYHPRRLFVRCAWDALSASVFFLPRPAGTVLILGLGGGVVARQCARLAPRARLVGVEPDERMLAAARRWFGLSDLDVEVHVETAESFLRRSRRRFDLILDDIWPLERDGSRPILSEARWLTWIGRSLRPDGVYAVNVRFREDGGNDRRRARPRLSRAFGRTCEVWAKDDLNGVIAAGTALRSPRDVRRSIGELPSDCRELRKLVLRNARGYPRA
jgi:spermidine synthase